MALDYFEGLENVFLTFEGKCITNTIEIIPVFDDLIKSGKSFIEANRILKKHEKKRQL